MLGFFRKDLVVWYPHCVAKHPDKLLIIHSIVEHSLYKPKMKTVLVALLLVSCALAVDWSSYTCVQMTTFTPASFSCANWNTFPLASVSCLSLSTSCGVATQCPSLNTVLFNALVQACNSGQNQFTSSTGSSSSGRP